MEFKNLIISPFFSPNIGGVESHLDDLIEELSKINEKCLVLTLAPVTTNINQIIFEENNNTIKIIRFPWKSSNLYHFFEKFPLFNFLYIVPYFFFRSISFILKKNFSFKNIHCHGFMAAFIGYFLNIKLKANLILSTHALYTDKQNFYLKIMSHTILRKFNKILCLSKSSKLQLESINPNLIQKIHIYRYWVDTNYFKNNSKLNSFKNITVTFIGRLIEKKGIYLFLNIIDHFPNINFQIVGNGPEESSVKKAEKKFKNLTYHGFIPNRQLNKIYNSSHFICFPSLYPEGFGRVMLESVSSGTPIIATQLGSIREAVNEDVALFIEPNFQSLYNTLTRVTSINIKNYICMRKTCRKFALNNFSPKNFQMIHNHYI